MSVSSANFAATRIVLRAGTGLPPALSLDPPVFELVLCVELPVIASVSAFVSTAPSEHVCLQFERNIFDYYVNF